MRIHGFGSIIIGDNVTINSDQNANPSAGGVSTHLSTCEKGKIIIGNNVGISNSAITARDTVLIEDYVLIGSNCMITDNDFHPLTEYERTNNDSTAVKSAPVIIKSHAFIGARSIILKGVTIGTSSIIGAGSVVTHDVPDGEIWAGNPARFIKKLE